MFRDFNDFLARVKPQSWAWTDIIGLVSYGTSGQVLTSNGADAKPTFQTASAASAITTIDSGSLATGTTKVLTLGTTYHRQLVYCDALSSDTASRQPIIQLSTDGGSSYDTTAGNHLFTLKAVGGALTDGTLASLIESANQAASGTWTLTLILEGFRGGSNPEFKFRISTGAGVHRTGWGFYIGSTSAVTHLKILWNGTGSFDGSGTYAQYGET